MGKTLPVIVGLAGHVDHGKTTLVQALTGTHTDRLPEERQRGMTIDLGFAQLPLPGGRQVSLIDVPGHERMLKNMLAGATGFDVVLLVVAADDSVMPQTREHLEILQLLGVSQGVVALTKIDAVDSEVADLAEADLREFLMTTPLRQAPIFRVSAPSGQGVAELKAALEEVVTQVPPSPQREARMRLPIDRVFTKPGFGNIVTGTLAAGTLREGDAVMVYPLALPARVRGVQVHGETVKQAVCGQRVALNLSGLDKVELERGAVVADPGSLQPSTVMDVQFTLLGGRDPLGHRTRIRLHLGTSEIIGRLHLLEGQIVQPGETVTAQLVLDTPAAAAFGERFVIRRYAPMETLGGGQVLLPDAPKRRRGPASAELLALYAGGCWEAVLLHLVKTRPQDPAWLGRQVPDGEAKLDHLVKQGHLVRFEGRIWHHQAVQGELYGIRLFVGQQHERFPWRAGVTREALQHHLKVPAAQLGKWLTELEQAGHLVKVGKRYRLRDFAPRYEGAIAASWNQLEAQLSEGFVDRKAQSGEAAGDLFDNLLDDGSLIGLSAEIAVTPEHLAGLKQQLERAFPHDPFTASEARELLGVSRKFLIPLLEYLDKVGFTRRQGDTRTFRAAVHS